ncbi:DUF3828 domain-containing protein [Hymenobacter sp. UV11]|uniref:DUF3828 domain-containing protein n=1 Tax=Hymenobacter sp. UV11 TaxID=1849735 RepID=UPI00105CD002|nr:DUF3828 domain-containing protein [Hymenobacter sp. UV11]TFZ62781.1 DUF3828 domain-containing protein [Hymenobacter sp. UV11]
MKAKILRFLLLIGCLSTSPYYGVQAQNTSTDRQAIAMLKEFYVAYITASSEPPTTDALKKLAALPKKYCTAGLLRKINAQYQQGHLDADPFTQSQDVDLSWRNTLVVRRDVRGANFYSVTLGDDISRFKVVIQLTVLKQSNSFRISSIRSFKYKNF